MPYAPVARPAKESTMKYFTRLVLMAAVAANFVTITPLHARTRRPRVVKTIDISDDPAVRAAEKRWQEAVKALSEAESRHDKTAIEAAQKEKNAAQKALSEARAAAMAAARKSSRR